MDRRELLGQIGLQAGEAEQRFRAGAMLPPVLQGLDQGVWILCRNGCATGGQLQELGGIAAAAGDQPEPGAHQLPGKAEVIGMDLIGDHQQVLVGQQRLELLISGRRAPVHNTAPPVLGLRAGCFWGAKQHGEPHGRRLVALQCLLQRQQATAPVPIGQAEHVRLIARLLLVARSRLPGQNEGRVDSGSGRLGVLEQFGGGAQAARHRLQ